MIDDVASMVRDTNGTFTVTCTDGRVERGKTSAEIAAQRVCQTGGSGTCVEGNPGACFGPGMQWTGSKCCVSGNPACVDGDSGACFGPGMQWTGSKCCLSGNPTCVDGTSGACFGPGMQWTGSKCCVSDD